MSTFTVCFVCTGNICRSPYADRAFRKIVESRGWGDRITVVSASTLGFVDSPAHSLGIACAAERGVDLSDHGSLAVKRGLISRCDLILGMSCDHIEFLREGFPEHADQLFLLGSYPEPHTDGPQVPDPMGKDEAAFRESFDLIDQLLLTLESELAVSLGLSTPPAPSSDESNSP